MKLKLALPILAAAFFSVGCQSAGFYDFDSETSYTASQEYLDNQDLFDHGYIVHDDPTQN